jgi:hypothetical protein
MGEPWGIIPIIALINAAEAILPAAGLLGVPVPVVCGVRALGLILGSGFFGTCLLLALDKCFQFFQR